MGYALIADLDTLPELPFTQRGVIEIFFAAKGVLLGPMQMSQR